MKDQFKQNSQNFLGDLGDRLIACTNNQLLQIPAKSTMPLRKLEQVIMQLKSHIDNSSTLGLNPALELALSLCTIESEKGLTPLHVVARKGFTQVAALLLEKGADIDVKNEKGETPLCYAIMSRTHPDIESMAQYLISQGADVNVQMTCGTTLLHSAITSDRVNLVSLLIEQGADINHSTKGGLPIFELAIKYHNPLMVQVFINAKIDVNKEFKNSATPLFIAVDKELLGIVKRLLEAGANPDLINTKTFIAPLQYAKKKGHPEILSLLETYSTANNFNQGQILVANSSMIPSNSNVSKRKADPHNISSKKLCMPISNIR